MALDDIQAILNDDEKFRTLSREAFGQVDTDNSGFIEKSELMAAMGFFTEKMGTSPPNDNDVQEVLKTLDSSEDAKISLEEFTKFFKDFLEEMVND